MDNIKLFVCLIFVDRAYLPKNGVNNRALVNYESLAEIIKLIV